MRNTFLLALLPLLILQAVCSCNTRHGVADNLLARIDSLADVNPDSADILLKHTPVPSLKERENEEVCKLLRIKIDDKLYRPVTHYRDTILQLIDYFEHHIDYHLPTAYYYAGRIFYDLGDMPQALDFYQKGSNACKDKKHRFLSNKLNAQMAYIFYNQDLFDEAIVYFQKGLNGCQEIADTMGMIYDLRDIACSYKYLHQYDSSLVYFDHALELALQSPQYNMQNNVMIQKASLYKEMGNYDASLGLIVPILAEPDSLNLTAIYSITAEDYLRTGYLDSASVYLENLLEYGNDYGRCDAHRWLAEIAMSKHDVTKGYYHLSELQRLSDTLRASQSAEIVARMHAAYNYQKHEREASRLRESNARMRLWLMLGAFFLVVSFGILLLARIRHAYRRKLERSTMSKVEILRLSHEQGLPEKEKAQAAIEGSAIYKTIGQYISEGKAGGLSENDWEELHQLVNSAYPNFKKKLNELVSPNEQDYRICLLTKINVKPIHIAQLTAHSPEAISSSRRRLYQKCTNKKGKPQDWDEIIRLL